MSCVPLKSRIMVFFQVLFVPYALTDRDHYADVARSAFVEMGFELESIHQHGAGPKQAVKEAQSIFIGGGNTFRLLKTLYDNDLVGEQIIVHSVPVAGDTPPCGKGLCHFLIRNHLFCAT